MANLVIKDLDDSAELDRQAMRKVTGGRRATPGLGLAQGPARSLLDISANERDSVLPKIGLGGGLLGGQDGL